MKEMVLVLIKPDAMRKAIAGHILDLFMAGKLSMTGLKVVKVSRSLAEAHYGHLRKEPFFAQIVDYLMGKFHDQQPVMAAVFNGRGAVRICRKIAGATSPEEADPRSVRGKFGRITAKGLFENLVHVSSDNQEARREISLWFRRDELL